MHQKAERPRPTILDMGAATLCLLYAGLFIVVGIGSPFLLINLCVALLPFFAAFSLIRCAYHLARALQYPIALGLFLFSLCWGIGGFFFSVGEINAEWFLYYGTPAVLSLLLAITHLFIAQRLRHRM